MKTIIINHPEYEISLDELQDDVNAAKSKFLKYQFSFTAMTVQALIDKVNELAEMNERQAGVIQGYETICLKKDGEIAGQKEIILSVSQYGKLKDGKFTYINNNGNEFVNKISNLFL